MAATMVGEEVKGAQQQQEEQQLLVVGSYCHDVLFRDGRLIGETLGGAAAFISNVLGALSSSSSHCYVSKVGPDFAYAVPHHQHHPPPPVAAASSTAPTTLFHAHFSSSSQKAPSGRGDRVLKRVRACDPILPSDLPSAPARFALGLAVGVAGEIPPETLARMLDLCRVLIVDVQALIRTFDPVDGTVSLVSLRDTAFFPLLHRITFLKASAEEAPFLNLDDARKSGCRLLITEGKGGCRLCCHYGDLHVPAFPAAVQVDPTGAGDSFLGGFTAGLLSGLPVPASALLGNFFGSITVGQIGIPKIDPRMLQKVKQELNKRSVHRVDLHGENDLVDFQAWDVDEDFRASLDAITKLPCNYNLIEITDCNDEHQQKLELKSACGAILPIKPN